MRERMRGPGHAAADAPMPRERKERTRWKNAACDIRVEDPQHSNADGARNCERRRLHCDHDIGGAVGHLSVILFGGFHALTDGFF